GAILERIIVLQPRRLATRMVASRVAFEMKSPVGETVGFQTRHESRVSKQSRIIFMTEGLFLRWMQNNPLLPGVGAVVLDEFHERSLAADMTLGLVRLLQESKRRDLKLIVMSATLNADALAVFLACPVVEAKGRMFPVEVSYLKARSMKPVWEQAAEAVAAVIDGVSKAGREREDASVKDDILVFQAGAYEINRTIDGCRKAVRSSQRIEYFPLHGSLSPREQDAAVEPRSDCRKVIVSTNIAETSITIDGVRHVIDTGFAKVHRYDARRGLNVLLAEPISQASAEQRAGRAGRTAPGTAMRLWTQGDHVGRAKHDDPEIRRLDLSECILQLKAMGAGDVRMFPWLDQPDEKDAARGEALLLALHALSYSPPSTGGQGGAGGGSSERSDEASIAHVEFTNAANPTLPQPLPKREGSQSLTPLGRHMAEYPLHPRLSRMMLEAMAQGCVQRAALWAALISERSILTGQPPAEYVNTGDDATQSDLAVMDRLFESAARSDFNPRDCDRLHLNAQACREVDRTRRQLEHIAKEHEGQGPGAKGQGRGGGATVALIKCLLTAFPDHIAFRPDEHRLDCRMIGRKKVVLDKSSVAGRPGLLLALEIRETGAGDSVRTTISIVSEIEPAWLEEVHPDRIELRDELTWNAATQAVEQTETHAFDGLVFFTKGRTQVDPAGAEPLLVEQIIQGNIKLQGWDEKVEQWITRVRCVAAWLPEKKLITYDEEDRRVILHEIVAGPPAAVRASQLRERPCLEAVMNALSWDEQQLIRQMAPESIKLPRGWGMKIEYSEGAAPRGRAKIQDLYDLDQTPRVAAGRVSVLLEILAPNHRPVQVTEDLASFWKNQYPQIKPALSRKYPRHEWR
ncbi:MAG: ATP-dependent helicase C-terminal domain-containing protein, partial [Phycisphaeraceae bacterium]